MTKNDNSVKSYCDPARRHDFVLLFDVTDGNPNGDPDAGNMPRVDPETMQGLVTDVCLKRKVRNFVSMTQPDEKPNRIYVQDRGVYLNDLHQEAHTAVGIEAKVAASPDRAKRDEARQWMCDSFFDVRMFGAVMGTKVNAGQVRGPVQLTFARSHDPIVAMDISITRLALTSAKEKSKEEAAGNDDNEVETGSRTGTMGRKSVVPYGLYRAHGFFSAPLAKQTGVQAADLELFWQALQGMWDLDRSAARGLMACRGLFVFSHENAFGNAPANELFDLCRIKLKTDRDPAGPPRTYSHYDVEIDGNLPDGVELNRLVG